MKGKVASNQTYKIGTVETVKVRKTGRRYYVNLDRCTVEAYRIQVGDILRVKLEEGHRGGSEAE